MKDRLAIAERAASIAPLVFAASFFFGAALVTIAASVWIARRLLM